MRWRALIEGKVYVKQKLIDPELRISDIQERIEAGDKHMADRIMKYGENIRGFRQFWMSRRYELVDMIKQVESEGMIFFTFSLADLHWPELHDLMPIDKVSKTESNIRQRNLVNNPHIAA